MHRLDKAGVGEEEGVLVGGEAEPEADAVCRWSKLQRVPGANVGEGGVGRHPISESSTNDGGANGGVSSGSALKGDTNDGVLESNTNISSGSVLKCTF